MSKTIRIRKGLDIRLKGEAEKVLVQADPAKVVAIKPTDIHGLVPKLMVKPGDHGEGRNSACSTTSTTSPWCSRAR